MARSDLFESGNPVSLLTEGNLERKTAELNVQELVTDLSQHHRPRKKDTESMARMNRFEKN